MLHTVRAGIAGMLGDAPEVLAVQPETIPNELASMPQGRSGEARAIRRSSPRLVHHRSGLRCEPRRPRPILLSSQTSNDAAARSPARTQLAIPIGRPMCSLHCRSRRTPVRSRRCGRSRSTTTPSTQSGRQDRRRRRCPPGVLQVPGRAWVHLRTTNPIESTLPPSVGAGVPEQPLGHGDHQLAMASYNLAMSPGDTCCGQLLRRLRSGLAMPCSSDHSAWWVAK